MEEFVAIGGSSTHQIGHVDARVLHGFAVPVNKEFVFLNSLSIRFTFAGLFSLFLEFDGVLDIASVLVEIVILSTRGTFGRATDMMFLSEFVVTESSQTPSTPTYGGADIGMFGIGFFSINGGEIAMIGETLFSQEDAVTR